ncbi:hypothetical protein [Microcystis phage Mae-JY35]
MVTWRTSPWFKVMRFGFCPNKDMWDVLRAEVLGDCHINIGDYPVNDGTAGMTTNWRDSTGTRHCLVTLADWLDTEPLELASTIAHECVHLATRLTEAMQDDEPSEEFMAYVVGGFVRDIAEDHSSSRLAS